SKPGPTNSPPANSNNSKSPPRTDVATTLCLRVPHPWFVRVGSYDRRPPYFLIFSLWSAAPWRRFRAFNPSYQPSSRPERPDFFLRADFWRVGPRSAVCAPRALRRGGGISLLPSSSAFLFCLPLLPSSSAFLFCLPLLPSSSAFLFCLPLLPGAPHAGFACGSWVPLLRESPPTQRLAFTPTRSGRRSALTFASSSGGRSFSFSSDIKCLAIIGLGRPWASAQGAKRP